MNYQKFLLLAFLSLSLSVQSEVKNNSDEVSLVGISKKLLEIENRLTDNRIFISSAIFEWKQLEQFRSDILFTVAHDPFGSPKKNIPAHLHPSYLTQKLKGTWAELELSVLEMGELHKDQEWNSLKVEVDQFFKLRDEFLYQPARLIIKSGTFMNRLDTIKDIASKMVKESTLKGNVDVKVLDPVLSKLTDELSVLNYSIKRLIALKTPPPTAPPTIFMPELLKQLYVFGLVIFSSTLFLVLSFIWVKTKLIKRSEPVIAKEVKKNAFNYYEWLKGLESGLQNLKKNEDYLTEQFIELKGLSHQLSEARKHFNEADNQQDYYKALENLNIVGPKIEEHFLNTNVRKNSVASRKVIGQIIQLCDAIENKKEINLDDEKPILRIIKVEQTIQTKAAG
jgi:hypothetical protein